MVHTTFLKKSLLACIAASPLVLTPSCTEEQKVYRLEVLQKETGRVVGFQVLSNAEEIRDSLYYQVSLYGEHKEREERAPRKYAVNVQTTHPDSKGQFVFVYQHLLRDGTGKFARDIPQKMVFAYSKTEIISPNAIMPTPLEIRIRPEDIPFYEIDERIAAGKR